MKIFKGENGLNLVSFHVYKYMYMYFVLIFCLTSCQEDVNE